jgi:hypothetical protein
MQRPFRVGKNRQIIELIIKRLKQFEYLFRVTITSLKSDPLGASRPFKASIGR